MPYLDVKLGSDSLLVRFVGRVDYVCGRLPKADIQFRDMSVSRLHVQFFIDSKGQCFVRDLGSSGGTLVNDTPISNTLARLHDGTRIRIGQARVIFYDASPPVNAVDPPGKSEPRGLIRFNQRKRVILGGETVLAADKVSAATADGGPAEPPPVINSAEFSEDGKAIEEASVRAPGAKSPSAPVAPPVAAKPAAPPAKPAAPGKKRDTGIMTAPWEDIKNLRGAGAPTKSPTVSLPPKPGQAALPPKPGQAALPPKPGQAAPAPSRPGATPPAPTRDAKGKPLPPAFDSTPPEEDSRKTLYEPPLPADQRPQARLSPRPGALGGPKPHSGPVGKPQPEKPATAPAPAQAPVPKSDNVTKRRTLAEEMLEDYEPQAAFPTVKLGSNAPAPRQEMPKAPAPPTPAPEDSEVEPKLSTDEIAEYFGGERGSGRLVDVKFADTDPAAKAQEKEEVNFGPGAARLANAAAEIEDDLSVPPTHENVVEPTTSLLGAGVTALDESKVDEEPVSDEPVAAAPAIDSPVKTAKPAPASAEEIADEHRRKLEEVKRIAREAAHASRPDAKLPPPQEAEPAPSEKPPSKAVSYPVALPGRDGAKRETRKLMKTKKDRDTEVIKEYTIPITENPTSKLAELAPGAKTLYIPKPEAVARQEAARNASKPDLESMGRGPGGDTLAVGSKDLMAELQQEYEKSQSKGDLASVQLAEAVRKEPVPVDKPAVDPSKTPPDMPALPDQETVKRVPTEGEDDDMEFIVDDNYAFFTPPPPTRKDRAAKARAEDEIIDAGDLLAQSEKLPPEKKAAERPQNDKTVSE